MKARLKQINSALPGLLSGIVLFGIICQIAGVFFSADKADYSIGLWIGVMTAVLMAFHMAFSLNMAVEMDEKGAQASATRHNIIRYKIIKIRATSIKVPKCMEVFSKGNLDRKNTC